MYNFYSVLINSLFCYITNVELNPFDKNWLFLKLINLKQSQDLFIEFETHTIFQDTASHLQ